MYDVKFFMNAIKNAATQQHILNRYIDYYFGLFTTDTFYTSSRYILFLYFYFLKDLLKLVPKIIQRNPFSFHYLMS